MFCTVAASYCSAAGGYAGTAPYKSFDDCKMYCEQWNRLTDPKVTTGAYNTMYMSRREPGRHRLRVPLVLPLHPGAPEHGRADA